jgi:hypothetical protein
LAQESLFPNPFHFSSLSDQHNIIGIKQPFGPTGLTSCLPPQVNLDATRLRLPAAASSVCPSAWGPRATTRAPIPFQNRGYPFLSSIQNRGIKKIHSPLVVSPQWNRLPSLLRPIKGVGSLTIIRCIYFPPSFWFLLRKNSFSAKLKSPPSRIHHSTAPTNDR